ncbi:hypothetical protein EV644_102383 [Kribbella orskensis]|uniref:Nucleotidyltransferase-like protein n=2 Tax=Kribbellaceae TaxID=2726069 RepID=A0ABY2BUF8_9ACTN|nr:hypothetical protein EV642_102354 [Kribbella sp. VKM Ac-2500]TCO29663.1 hypothetical protein EV644_102383 [Kribbella orskensis]
MSAPPTWICARPSSIHRMTSDEAVQLLLDGFVASVCGLLPVRAVWVHGSLALGDFQVGRSDFDLIAVLDGPIVDPEALCALHRSLEKTDPLAEKLHCSYMQVDQLADASLRHPTWAQQRYFDRPVGAVTRRELALGDRSLFGPPPSSLLSATTDEELAAFIRDDLEHFWYPATRKLTPWYTDIWVDLGLITVARAAVTLTTGHLITKQAALSLLPSLGAPQSVVTDIHHRRYGTPTRATAPTQHVTPTQPTASTQGTSPTRHPTLGRDAALALPSPLWRLRRGQLARSFVRRQIADLLDL